MKQIRKYMIQDMTTNMILQNRGGWMLRRISNFMPSGAESFFCQLRTLFSSAADALSFGSLMRVGLVMVIMVMGGVKIAKAQTYETGELPQFGIRKLSKNLVI